MRVYVPGRINVTHWNSKCFPRDREAQNGNRNIMKMATVLVGIINTPTFHCIILWCVILKILVGLEQ